MITNRVGRTLQLSSGKDELGDRQDITVADLMEFLEACEQAEVPEDTPIQVSEVLSSGSNSGGALNYRFRTLKVEVPLLDLPAGRPLPTVVNNMIQAVTGS